MLSMADTKIETVLPFFTGKGVDIALLVPTSTGYGKSIMDATSGVREFLSRNNIHEYNQQHQGQDYKVVYPAFFVQPEGLMETTASLYRPITKKGDPRIWFRNLKEYCHPNNLLGLAYFDNAIYVFNLSSPEVINSLRNDGKAADLVSTISGFANAIAMELLEKLNRIHLKGFIRSLICGDTGIGMTLEHELDILPNSSKAPDYKGIELKSSRNINRGNKTRVSLFSQIPDWENSNLKSAQEIIKEYGYIRNERLQLYCTVDAVKPNSQGLYFFIDEKDDILYNRGTKGKNPNSYNEVVKWEMPLLRSRLEEKHKETFWVKASVEVSDGVEYFRYDTVEHTRKPNIHLMGALFDSGIITMDYTLSQMGNRIRDHGYLFKINPKNIDLLFPSSQIYDL